jgi:hypothetical protein
VSRSKLAVAAALAAASGNAFERAGLTNGVLSVIRVAEKVGGARPATTASRTPRGIRRTRTTCTS